MVAPSLGWIGRDHGCGRACVELGQAVGMRRFLASRASKAGAMSPRNARLAATWPDAMTRGERRAMPSASADAAMRVGGV